MLLRMIILEGLKTTHCISKPCALTIGNFDGVHLGHQALIKRIREITGPDGTVCVLTFSNHPSYTLPGSTPVPLISSKSLKLKYLEENGVDIVYCLEFTRELAQKEYDLFLNEVKAVCPFEVLVLGEGATLGRKKGGTPEKIKELGEKLGFSVEYLPKMKFGAKIISSGVIRKCILTGHLKKAAELLGHPLKLEAYFENNTLHFSKQSCIPPDGSYPILIQNQFHEKPAQVSIREGKMSLNVSLQDQKFFILFY